MMSYKDLQKFRPQQTALSGGTLLVLNSGIHFGYTFYDWTSTSTADDSRASWTKSIPSPLICLAVSGWFMGSILGSSLAPLSLRTFSSIKVIYIIGNGLALFAALLFILLPELFLIVLAGRFIAGIGYGLVYVALIQHYGEMASGSVGRGRIGAAIHLFLLKGGLISGPIVVEYFNQAHRIGANRFLGFVSISLSSIAIVMTVIFYKDSPLRMMLNGCDSEAREMLILLNDISIGASGGGGDEDEITTRRFNELKSIAEEDKFAQSASICASENRQQLLAVLLLRFSFVLSYNDALKSFIHITIIACNIQHIPISSSADTAADAGPKMPPTMFVLNLIHTLVVVLAMFTIDKVGKRAYFLISGFGTALTLVMFACFRATWDDGSDFHSDATTPSNANVTLVFAFFVTFEICSALGLGSTANVYSTEAFQTWNQPGSVALTCIFEHCLQILLVIVRHQSVEHSSLLDVVLLLSSGVSLFAISTYLLRCLPETKQLSLYEARHSFRRAAQQQRIIHRH